MKQEELDIELSDDVAQGVYVNLAMITHSSVEFVVDCIQIMPGVPKGRVKTRVIMAPENAKKLMFALSNNVMKYEQTYGTIQNHDEVNEPEDPFQHIPDPATEA